jgi:hypothetical protein
VNEKPLACVRLRDGRRQLLHGLPRIEHEREHEHARDTVGVVAIAKQLLDDGPKRARRVVHDVSELLVLAVNVADHWAALRVDDERERELMLKLDARVSRGRFESRLTRPGFDARARFEYLVFQSTKRGCAAQRPDPAAYATCQTRDRKFDDADGLGHAWSSCR